MLLNKIFNRVDLDQFMAFFFALAITYILTPVIQSRAVKLGVLDKPSDRKLHTTPIPRLGGVAIYLSIFITSLLMLPHYWNYSVTSVGTFTLLGVFASGTIIFFVGLLDDLEPLSPQIKLTIQLIAATIAWYLGVKIITISNPLYHADFGFFKLSIGGQAIPFDPLISYFLTVIWIVGITNAINLIDGMDGLATGISLIGAMAIWAVSVDFKINQPGGALMAATIAGALLGFLRWNFNPARIFLGDSGAYLIGFLLASLTIGCTTKKVAIAVITPLMVLIFALPIVDTTLAIIRRLISGRPIMQPDKEHLHHKLLQLGFSQKITSYVLYTVSASFGILATYIISRRSCGRFLVLSALVVVIALFYALVINWKRQKIFRCFLPKKDQ